MIFKKLKKEFSTELPITIWILGLVSFFMNSASIVITALTPEFVMHILCCTPAAVGYIRGTTEALSFIVKLFSGIVSDYIGKRKVLVLIGYSCAAITKPMFAMANGLGLYIFAQTLERVANGMRDTPRDALIADCVPKHLKGTSFGIRQSFAYAGSMVGAIACFFIMSNITGNTADCIRSVYWIATIPVFIAVLLLYFGIQDSQNLSALKNRKGFPIKKADLEKLGPRFWGFICVVFMFMCARYSESFLVVRASELGMPLKYVPLVLAVMYMFNAPTAKFVGKWSDHSDRRVFLLAGFFFMGLSCLILAFSKNLWHVIIGVAIYGLHYGATQGTFFAMVSDYSPPQIKGTSFGIFNLVCAFGMFISNVLTGELWKHCGAKTALITIACITFSSLIAMFFVKHSEE